MKKLYPALAIVALAASANADWLLSKFEYPTADSLTTAKLYGVQPFVNQASKGLTTVPAPGGFVRFVTTLASDPATARKGDGYSANVGILMPLTADWAEYSLDSLKEVDFEFRNENEITKATDGFSVAFGSKGYDSAFSDSGQVYTANYTVDLDPSAPGVWKTVKMPIKKFIPPSWWTPPTGYPTKASILKRVTNLQFAPNTDYGATEGIQKKAGGKTVTCAGCVGPTMTAQTIEVRNVKLIGVDKYTLPNKTGIGCTGDKAVLVDDFKDAGLTTSAHMAFGFWYSYQDSGDADTTKAKGTSSAKMTITKGEDGASGYASLTSSLKKKSPAGVWQDYAGWGALGLDFRGQKPGDLTGLTGIQFTVGDITTNKDRVETVTFKLAQEGIADADVYSVELSLDQLGTAGQTVCIRPSDVKQPTFSLVKTPLDLKKITRLAWETKITNNNNTAIDTGSASIFLTDIKLFGVGPDITVNGVEYSPLDDAGVSVRKAAIKFDASYANGNLSLSGYKGVDAFEVLSLDGKKVSSFAPAANVALNLSRGTYFLVAKRGSVSTARKLAVVSQ